MSARPRTRYVDSTRGLFVGPAPRSGSGDKVWRLYLGHINGGNRQLATITQLSTRNFMLHMADGTHVVTHARNLRDVALDAYKYRIAS
jgi:hypothetical protein